jgi:hypothetical protein
LDVANPAGGGIVCPLGVGVLCGEFGALCLMPWSPLMVPPDFVPAHSAFSVKGWLSAV